MFPASASYWLTKSKTAATYADVADKRNKKYGVMLVTNATDYAFDAEEEEEQVRERIDNLCGIHASVIVLHVKT